MKKLLLVLVLFSLIYPTDGELCSFSPEDEEAQESFETGMNLVYAAILLSVVVVALSYMVGKITSNPRLLVFSKNELTQLVITVIVAIFILSFLEGTCYFFTYFLDLPQGPIIAAQNYMYGLQIEGKLMLGSLISESINQKFSAARVYGYVAPITGGEIFYHNSFYTAGARQYEILSDLVTVGYVSAGVQYYLLMFIQAFVFPVLLPFGLLLRALPFVRDGGNVILAICFSLLIIFPIAYAVNSSAAEIDYDYCDEDKERYLGDCTSLRGWGRISAYLFQTVFLPGLAMVVSISGVSAMVKVARVMS
ncbi:MAG: hypothetical protein ACLFUZ_02005 [Candidatus Micrarchaeia archaeon]